MLQNKNSERRLSSEASALAQLRRAKPREATEWLAGSRLAEAERRNPPAEFRSAHQCLGENLKIYERTQHVVENKPIPFLEVARTQQVIEKAKDMAINPARC